MIDTIKNSTEKQRAGHTSKMIKLPDFKEKEKLGYLLGCIAGDGHLAKTQVLLDNNDKDIQEKYSEYLKELFNLDSFIKQNHTCQTVVNRGGLTFKRFINEIIGIPDKNKSAKVEVPVIAQNDRNIFRGFFAGLIDTDGYVSHINNSIELTSKSKKMIKQCSILLLNFGILSTVYDKDGFKVLRIANKKYLDKFIETFNLRLKRKMERVIKASKKAQSSRIFDMLPIPKDELKKLKLPAKINKIVPYTSKYLKNQNLTESFLKKLLDNLKEENSTSRKINMLLESDVGYTKVVSKEMIKNKDKYVYDFTVPGTHNFVAERVIVHNTSILDRLRGTTVAAGEAGGITQKISFTKFPKEKILENCPVFLKSAQKLELPGFLFIDTPGHAAFTNLRKRGGSLADMAILVIDINEGIKPQTAEVIQILKHNKTPFIIALNKIDSVGGWRRIDNDLKRNIESQAINVKNAYEEKLYMLMGALHNQGFETDLYYNLSDFTKKVAMIPCSAKTGEGISDLLMMLCGLSQKFLKGRITLGKKARGVMLEVKKEKTIQYSEAILYDGKINVNDTIAIATLSGEMIVTKIRTLEEIQPLSRNFKPVKEATAATGLRIQTTDKTEAASGMPFIIYENNDEEIMKEFKKEVMETIQTENEGVIVKADSLGSLEATLTLLKQANIKVLKAGIGRINKTDIINAKANLESDPATAAIIGFNVEPEDDAKELLQDYKGIKLFTGEVVYGIIDELGRWQIEKRNEILRKKLMALATVGKIEVLPQYVFRNSNPAIFGVRIVGGKIKTEVSIIDEEGIKVGRIKAIQHEKSAVGEATEGMEVAISIPGQNFERRLKEKKYLYTDISNKQLSQFRKNKELLSSGEMKVLAELNRIKNPGEV